jgi:2-dehydro-3-deoxygluconokinase
MKRRLVSIGESMVEMAPAPLADQYKMGFSGDTLNTAWYARRLLPADWLVDYVTAVGTDAVSDRMVDFIAANGIGTGHIRRQPDRTVGLYLIELKDGERSFAYWRSESAARRLADNPAHLAQAFQGADLLYLSGITLAILDAEGRKTLMSALDTARANGSRIAFDPNLRPRLWPDTKTMCDAVTEASRRADIVLPSHEDEASYFSDTSVEATARRYADCGAGTVVVKNGSGQILAYHAGAITAHEPVSDAKVVDTTAAGDSFNAGYLAALLTGKSMGDAVDAGKNLAAKVIGGHGALVDVV